MTAPNTDKLTRRAFLRKMGAGAAVIAAFRILPGETLIAYAGHSEANGPAILIDLTRCVGCNSCALACKATNDMPAPDVEPDALSSTALTFVEEREGIAQDGTKVTRYVKRQCMHCLDAACVSACPAGAMHKSAEGPVIYRSDLCLGCRYCQVACPFSIPRFDWDNGIDPVISKCWMCQSRLAEGQQPACVEACPTGALRFGQRDVLLAQAHAQIASNPRRYIDHVYGEFEVGGTSMLYISDVPFEQLGFVDKLPDTAPPKETEKIMGKLPAVIGGMTALMAGTAVYTHRKPAEELQPVSVSGEDEE